MVDQGLASSIFDRDLDLSHGLFKRVRCSADVLALALFACSVLDHGASLLFRPYLEAVKR